MASPVTQRPPALDRIVQRFKRASSNKLRYEQLLTLAQKLPEFPEEQKLPENKVPGCVSQVYVTASLDSNGCIQFQGDSDSQLTKGLLAMLIKGMNGLTIQEISQLKPDFIEETGLQASLTPSRANGFYNIFKTLQKQASACGE
ncbi:MULTISPECIES: SufE family protein [Arthrospira]|uniref:SufE family protein n=1 Tax=Oscillatoriales TaxID=1150 RepID=UPI0001C38A50|nr:SufE family protein [Arthrospira platensis]AMW28036.1 cysteine desufuration protein SufE [Arthrospira platensis YZ]KDR57159.1 cysteine desufuration protein SufE [Arthrospira platensis str. Paraca]MBD2668794.1 SufE family protein [Arthrospira platensis FACHB-439]MBD2710161.1 SufE family protein [Arthrospira platensis FACHB-835]MDT9311673.1 SufE family protein [Limnospira sp. Paracas R14]QQW30832.1 SufE family protein [Arthrospira sp. PCC 9108]